MTSQISLDIDSLTDMPIQLNQVKDQLRIDHQEFDDVILMIHLPGAVAWAEGFMQRSIMSREHRWILSNFPKNSMRWSLPRGQCTAISSIVYKTNGVATTLTGPTSGSPEGTDWQEDLRNEDGGVLMPPRSGSWPSADHDVPDPVVVTFTAGYATEEDVPGEIKAGLMFYIGEKLELASPADFQVNAPVDYKESLISGLRLHRW